MYSRTFLHATKCISLGFDSLTMTRLFFLITVFLRLCVSSVIVVGEFFVIVPCGIGLLSGLSVPGAQLFYVQVFCVLLVFQC